MQNQILYSWSKKSFLWSADFLFNLQVTQPIGRPQWGGVWLTRKVSVSVYVCVYWGTVEAGNYQVGRVFWGYLGPAEACPLSFLPIWRTLLKHQQAKKIFNPLHISNLDTFSSVPSKMVITSVWHYFPLITKLPRRLTKQWLTTQPFRYSPQPMLRHLHWFCLASA